MSYKISADTDIGIKKTTNQDSLIVRKAKYGDKSIVFSVLCDGMGGLSEGEVASKRMLEAMINWFDRTYPINLATNASSDSIKEQWFNIVFNENVSLKEYGKSKGINLGTTLTAMLIEDDIYYAMHIGDCRIYEIGKGGISQLTFDHTVIAREIALGNITSEQAKVDPRRNVLLQCIGASDIISPDFFEGKIQRDSFYLICTDGFRHVISSDEVYETFINIESDDEDSLKNAIRKLINLNKERKETDNISAVVIKS